MGTEQITTLIVNHLKALMDARSLKLQYVAECAGVGVETVRPHSPWQLLDELWRSPQGSYSRVSVSWTAVPTGSP